jgi:hypothetical protein
MPDKNDNPANSVYPEATQTYSPDELDINQRKSEQQANEAMAKASLEELNQRGINNPDMGYSYHFNQGGGNGGKLIHGKKYRWLRYILLAIVILLVIWEWKSGIFTF